MSDSLKIAILGTKGIGKFHVREYINANTKVVAILGKTKRNTKEICNQTMYNINYYSNLEKMLEKEAIDAVSICTPPETHYKLVKSCLENNLNVLCEKPLVNSFENNYYETKELIELSKKKNKILAVNTQWPFVLGKILPQEKISSFEIYMEPGELDEKMLLDHLPHANSILLKILPQGKMKNFQISLNKKDEKRLEFDFFNINGFCHAQYHFKYNSSRPRKIIFSFNDKIFERKIKSEYKQFFEHNFSEIDIEDPLKLSIRNFVNTIQNKEKQFISQEEILESALLQDEIFKELKYINP